ncbi:ParB/RepB/Spo0J family partition protein [Streptomyces mirabilis]|uniref:ParB/RepB/Spo0J family partition protein n=1 Tax=Streptomyces mirabilis TaxID=68239 RepID=UPI00342C7DEF
MNLHQSDSETLILEPAGRTERATGSAAPLGVPKARTIPVPIALLLPGESPRSEGPDEEHVARLAEIDGPLPAILVRRSDMRVIDGMHRLLAALIRGQETIEVEFFDGSAEAAFLRAVEANIAHGLPLSQSDRRAAATRIIVSHPQMSDRAIARASGLGAKAVAAIRRRSSDALPQLNARIGRDGRIRPLSSVEGRRRAAEVIAENPRASLREVARLAGISPATASDVRKRIQSGEPPAPVRTEVAPPPVGPAPALTATLEAQADITGHSPSEPGPHDHKVRLAQPDPSMVLEKLLRDPSLRLKDEGRQLLRLLQENGAAEWNNLTAAVPPHCGAMVGSLARRYAATWLEFAQYLDERDRSVPKAGRVLRLNS